MFTRIGTVNGVRGRLGVSQRMKLRGRDHEMWVMKAALVVVVNVALSLLLGEIVLRVFGGSSIRFGDPQVIRATCQRGRTLDRTSSIVASM